MYRVVNQVSFAKKRLLLNILSFLESELSKDVDKKDVFQRIMGQITSAYGIDYAKEKDTIKEVEDLTKIIGGSTEEFSKGEFNKQILVNTVLKFFVEECAEGNKKKSLESVLYDFENLAKTTKASKKAAAKEDLLKIFTDHQINYYANNGRKHLLEGQFEVAVDHFSAALSYAPFDETLYCGRAAAHNFLGNYRDAVLNCFQAIRINPSYPQPYVRLGWVFIQLHRYQEAIDAFQKALDLKPNNQHYKECVELAKQYMKDQETNHCVIS